MQMPTNPMMFTRVFVAFLVVLLSPACSSNDNVAAGTGGKGSGSGASGGSAGGAPGTGGLSAGTGGTLGSGGTLGTGGQAASTGGASAGTGGVNSTGTGGSDTASSGGRGSGEGGGARGGSSGTAGTGGGMAGTGGAAGAGGVAADSYNPCPPAGQPCRVMPLGDSITQGTDGSTHRGGYRLTLFQLAHMAGKSIDLVGSRSAGPATVDGAPFPAHHEGYPGYTVSGLLGNNLTPNNIKTYKPHIVLLMIGTNDLARPGAMPAGKLAELVDIILAADPNLLLFLAQITPGQTFIMPTSYNPSVNAYNAAMVSLVNERAAAGKHIRLADMHTPFVSTPNYDTVLMHNGVHPNDAGYKVMGETWYGLLKTLLR